MPLPIAAARREAKKEEREAKKAAQRLSEEYTAILEQGRCPLPAKCPHCGGLLPHIGGRCK